MSPPRLVCAACGTSLRATWPATECACGGLLDVRRDVELRGPALRARFERRVGKDPRGQGSGVWRFRELVLETAGPIVSHPEGNTPLRRREAIARYAGVADLVLKHEGENPTGSFKEFCFS